MNARCENLILVYGRNDLSVCFASLVSFTKCQSPHFHLFLGRTVCRFEIFCLVLVCHGMYKLNGTSALRILVIPQINAWHRVICSEDSSPFGHHGQETQAAFNFIFCVDGSEKDLWFKFRLAKQVCLKFFDCQQRLSSVCIESFIARTKKVFSPLSKRWIVGIVIDKKANPNVINTYRKPVLARCQQKAQISVYLSVPYLP